MNNVVELKTGPITRKPSWVPDWVWEQYKRYRHCFEGEHSDPWAAGIMDELIKSRDCMAVLENLKRREISVDPSGSDDPYPAFVRLYDTVSEGLYGFDGHDRMTQAERAKNGGRIARLAANLRKAIETTWAYDPKYDMDEEVDLPFEVRNECVGRTRALLSELASNHPANDCDKWPKKERDKYILGMAIGHEDIVGVLTALEQGALAWGKSKPNVARPNAENADRIWFIRRVTEAFRRTYGTPLRECTRTLTSIFFEADDLDAAAIAHLAPCSEPDD